MPCPLCEHTMSSGIRCGSPAQSGQKHCFYHGSVRTLLPKRFIGHEQFRNEYDHGCRLFPMPLLEDATSIQTALMQVIHATLEGAIHFRAASIVLSALRTAQRNLALVKLEMAATSQAALQRELPSDAGQKAEVTFSNRPDDTWETSYIGRSTASPPHLNGDLGYREPKIPPDAEGEPAAQSETAATPQGDLSSTADGMDTFTAARPSTDSTINGMGRLPGTDDAGATPSPTSNTDAGASSTQSADAGACCSSPSADAGMPAFSYPHSTDSGAADPPLNTDASQPASAPAALGAPPFSPVVGERVGTNVAVGAGAPSSSPAVGERVGTNTEAAAPARKQPLPFPSGGLDEQDEPKQKGQAQTERSD
jgi:hypothetical protein